MTEYLPYILVMAVVTYLIRMLPLTFFQKEIRSPFIKSFLFYVPYAVLGAMTFPAIFTANGPTPASRGLLYTVTRWQAVPAALWGWYWHIREKAC